MSTKREPFDSFVYAQAKLKALLALDAGAEQASGEPELMSVDLLFCDVSDSEDFRLLKQIALERCTILELSEELGVSVEACKKRVQRARKRLQKKLKV